MAAMLDSPDRQLLNGKQTKADIRSSERNGNVRDFHDIAVRAVVPQQRYSLSAGQAKVSTYVSYHDSSSHRKESGLPVVNSYYLVSRHPHYSRWAKWPVCGSENAHSADE